MANNQKYSTVTRASNWGYWDEIDGAEMYEGRYLVKWQDDTITEEQVKIHRGKLIISDMGNDADIRDDYAYVEASTRGQVIELRLTGLEVCPLDPRPKTEWEKKVYDLLKRD